MYPNPSWIPLWMTEIWIISWTLSPEWEVEMWNFEICFLVDEFCFTFIYWEKVLKIGH